MARTQPRRRAHAGWPQARGWSWGWELQGSQGGRRAEDTEEATWGVGKQESGPPPHPSPSPSMMASPTATSPATEYSSDPGVSVAAMWGGAAPHPRLPSPAPPPLPTTLAASVHRSEHWSRGQLHLRQGPRGQSPALGPQPRGGHGPCPGAPLPVSWGEMTSCPAPTQHIPPSSPGPAPGAWGGSHLGRLGTGLPVPISLAVSALVF